MKKILSLTLAALLLVSMIPTAMAAENNWQGGTKVEYTAATNEQYTVTVPATLAPGGSGDVVASGTWGSNRKLTVTADDDVTLTNSINAADQKVLDVTFAGIELTGSNTESVSDTKQVAVANITDAIFGTWSGTFNYNVAMSDVAGGSGTVTPTPDPDDDATVAKFYIDGEEYEYEEGMTYSEWVASEYNTKGYVIAEIKNIEWNVVRTHLLTPNKDAYIQTVDGGTNIMIQGNVKVSTLQHVSVPLEGSGYELVEPEANLITFTIKNTEYQAEAGMTWGEWIDSEYNTSDMLVYEAPDQISNGNGYYVAASDGTHVKTNEVIVANASYTTAK